MKRVRVLIAFLIGVPQAIAGSIVEKYQDSLTQYTVIRPMFGTGNHYEIFEEEDNTLASSFTLERIAGKVLLKDFSIPESSKDENGFYSLVTIIGYLENKGYTVCGSESDFFLNDAEENESFYADNGFALLAEIPEFLRSITDAENAIYRRVARASFQVTGDNGFEGYIER